MRRAKQETITPPTRIPVASYQIFLDMTLVVRPENVDQGSE